MPITEDFYVFSCLSRKKEIKKDDYTTICDKPELIISPITPDEKKPARRDFIEQCQRIKNGLPLVWDDLIIKQGLVINLDFGFIKKKFIFIQL